MSLRERTRPGLGIIEPCLAKVFKNADFTRGPNPRRWRRCGFPNRTSIKELGLCAASFRQDGRNSIVYFFCFVLGLG